MAYTYKQVAGGLATVLTAIAAGTALWYQRTATVDAPRPQDEAEIMAACLERQYASGDTNRAFVSSDYKLINTVGFFPNAPMVYPARIRAMLGNYFPPTNMPFSGARDAEPSTTWEQAWTNFVTLPTNGQNVGGALLFAFERDNDRNIWRKRTYSDMARALSLMQWKQQTVQSICWEYQRTYHVSQYMTWTNYVTTNVLGYTYMQVGQGIGGGVEWGLDPGTNWGPIFRIDYSGIVAEILVTNQTPFRMENIRVFMPTATTNAFGFHTFMGGGFSSVFPEVVSHINAGVFQFCDPFVLEQGEGRVLWLDGKKKEDLPAMADQLCSDFEGSVVALMLDALSPFNPQIWDSGVGPYYFTFGDATRSQGVVTNVVNSFTSGAFGWVAFTNRFQYPDSYSGWLPCMSMHLRFSACTDYLDFAPAR